MRSTPGASPWSPTSSWRKAAAIKAELGRLKKELAARHTEVLLITLAISQRAAASIDALSHSLRLAKALIGASALEAALPSGVGPRSLHDQPER